MHMANTSLFAQVKRICGIPNTGIPSLFVQISTKLHNFEWDGYQGYLDLKRRDLKNKKGKEGLKSIGQIEG